MSQKPSVGRVLHIKHDGVIRPAIITAVKDDGRVELRVFAGLSDCIYYSVPVADDEVHADLAVANGETGPVPFWPPRV